MNRLSARLSAIAALIASCALASCGGGGGGGGSSPIPPGGGGTVTPQNYMPLANGNTWTYQANIVYTMNGPVAAGGQTTYGYQGGCQEREFYYKDASQNVYSIGQNPNGGLTPSSLYPSPELILKGVMVNGDHWQNNLGFTTESVSVAGPVNVTVNGTATPGWTLTYTDTQAGSTPNVITYVAGIGAVQVTDYCVSPSAQRNLISYSISPSST